jgi:hypothetical protein
MSSVTMKWIVHHPHRLLPIPFFGHRGCFREAAAKTDRSASKDFATLNEQLVQVCESVCVCWGVVQKKNNICRLFHLTNTKNRIQM